MMRNPYIVGRWLRGEDHYGRHKPIEYMLTTKDQAIWLVGTRRIGKTSMLRQLEWLTAQDPDSAYVPLFWDLQGCEDADDLAYYLFVAVEDESARFSKLGIDIPSLEAMDVNRILREVQRTLSGQGKQLLLLIDEAEALINVAKNNSRELARLRQTLQRGEHRTILAATTRLTELNESMRTWLTSPFLFGFNMINLWSLDMDSARSLVRQGQGPQQVTVAPEVMDAVLTYTNRHPYLIQYLCHRLFETDAEGAGYLRPVGTDDLHVDDLLVGFLQIDYEHLSAIERQILLVIAHHGLVDEETIERELNIISPTRIEHFLYGMNKRGYVREILGGWAVGNEFLRRWVSANQETLARQIRSAISDENVELMLQQGRDFEVNYLHQEIGKLQQREKNLVARISILGDPVPTALADALQQTRREMEAARAQIRQLGGGGSADAP